MNRPDEIDPHAETILRRFSDWLRCLKNFRVDVIMTVESSIRGMTIPKMLDTKHALTVCPYRHVQATRGRREISAGANPSR